MKKHLSVLGLFCRSSALRLLALFSAAISAELLLFCLQLPKGQSAGIEYILENSGIKWVLLVWFLLCTVILARSGCSWGSRPEYTLSRLRVSEKTFFLWQSVYNSAVFSLLLMAQIITSYVMCLIYMSQAPREYVTNQTLFLAFYRSDFLHSIMPLEDALRWVYNIIAVVSMGIITAYYPLMQRRGKFAFSAVVVSLAVVFGFIRGMETFSIMPFICAIAAAAAVFNGCVLQTGFEDDGEEEYDDGYEYEEYSQNPNSR